MRTGRSLTIKDIAELAGVSHSTVSRALNNSSLVNENTRLKIQKIARERNFAFNASARSLSRRETGVIGVIYMTGLDVFGASLYAAQLFQELRHCLERYQLDPILLEAYDPVSGQSNIRRLLIQNKVDAFLLIHSYIREEDYRQLEESGLPVVQLHAVGRNPSRNNLDFFITDNVLGGKLAAAHLIERGCRRILTLTVREENDSNREFERRTQGFLQGVKESPLSVLSEVRTLQSCSYRECYAFIKEHKALIEQTDGLFLQADILAFAAVSALNEIGIPVPGSIRLIGYDDTAACLMTEPEITTIHQPKEELCRQACEHLFRKMKGKGEEDSKQVRLEPYVIQRGSS